MKLGGGFDKRKLKRLVINVNVILKSDTINKDVEILAKLKEKYEIWLLISSHKQSEKIKEYNISYYNTINIIDITDIIDIVKIVEQISPLIIIENEPKIISKILNSDDFKGIVWVPNHVKIIDYENYNNYKNYEKLQDLL